MSDISNWMYVEVFTVDQAAALWCGIEPSRMKLSDSSNPSEAVAVKQMLAGAIMTGQLQANSEANPFSSIGNYSMSFVSRDDLKAYAEQRKLFPAFLFNTLASFGGEKALQASTHPQRSEPVESVIAKTDRNVGGRPPEYDWDSFILEVICRANSPDGLPETQAELIRDMLQWFSDTYGVEPAESAVKQRISKIYNYLKKSKNLQG
ncbi:hypothetical protein OEG84_13440 [Hoeflea sp. G2-23]|uniref:Uncharacterized protein n=1 Tax=Hoeflea algicola TaxID=2983763 RepID=A0ABT3ZA57_9HYPH|nr:hypothetical protein [Hoeflea algicola]MCY0148676.1 hypothetical protein [Hoeflea algicola]